MSLFSKHFAAFVFVIGSLVAAPGIAWATPSNPTCQTAEVVGFPSVTASSTADEIDSSEPSTCGKGDVYPVWYSFVTPAAGRYEFTTESASGVSDTTVAVFGACDAAALACDDDTPTDVQGAVTLDLPANQQLYVRVAGWGERRGDLKLTIAHPEDLSRPVNDNCGQATPLGFQTSTPGTTLHATGADVSSCGGEDSVDIWYTFIAPETRHYDFYLSQNLTSANLVSVYRQCGTEELACGLHEASLSLEAGEEVYVRVGSNPDVADTFNMNVGPMGPVIVPSNDHYDQAIPVHVGDTVSGTTAGATPDNLSYGPVCDPWVNASVWYSFTAPDDAIYVFDTSDSEMASTAIAFYEDCHSNGDLPPIWDACDFQFGRNGNHGRLDGFIPKGKSYCIAIGGYYLSEHGGYTLKVDTMPDHPENDRCDHALAMGYPDTIEAENYAVRSDGTFGPCPAGDFPLWYSFTAPADGLYKFDGKQTTETQPDVAVYADCLGTQLACSIDQNPSASVTLTEGQEVFVRISTDGSIRSPMVLHVGPEPTAPPEETGGMGGMGSTSSATVSTSEATGATSGAGGSGDARKTDDEGCGCAVAPSEDAALGPLGLLALGLLARRHGSARRR